MSGERARVLDPGSVGWVETYRRLTEVVVPRPIAVVSTVDGRGRANLAPFSFFTIVSCNPPYLAVAPQLAGRTGARKDTLCNAEEVGELVIAVATEEIAEQVNRCSAALERGESEFDHSGLTPLPASRVRPRLVAESPVNMECEVVEIHHYGENGGGGNLIVARLLLMHIAETVLDEDGSIRPDRLRAVGRMGGDFWCRSTDTFTLERP